MASAVFSIHIRDFEQEQLSPSGRHLKLHLKQPRSQALSSCGGKTLAGAGHVTHRKLIA
jgi:hypothetical protein